MFAKKVAEKSIREPINAIVGLRDSIGLRSLHNLGIIDIFQVLHLCKYFDIFGHLRTFVISLLISLYYVVSLRVESDSSADYFFVQNDIEIALISYSNTQF